MEIQAGVSDFVTLKYEDRIELIEGNLQLDDKKKALCGGDLSLKLETEHSFFSHDAGSWTLFLESTENTREGEYEDSYLSVKIDTYELTIPVKASFKDC